MSFLPADPTNCEIIAHSLALQRKLPVVTHPDGRVVGAQQAMPKPEHRHLFSAENPLPWVPDRVGTGFSRVNNGVLVVGSSYNGFIEGYSQRSMKLENYLAIRDLIREGNEDPAHPKVAEACALFVREFERQVMKPDVNTYYGPILNKLLRDLPASRICLTDLCKASFVQMGKLNKSGDRLDTGDDSVVRRNWEAWTKFLVCGQEGNTVEPSPANWLWRRMQQCRQIIALGTIAEYGVIKMFKRMAGSPTIGTRNDGTIHLHKSLAPEAAWKYRYADSTRKLSHWLRTKDWWVLSDEATGHMWNLLPVYHPARHLNFDPDYGRSRQLVQVMIATDVNGSNAAIPGG